MSYSIEESNEPSFLHYLGILRRRVLVIGVAVVIVVVAVVALDSVRTKMYSSTSSLQLLSQNVSQYGIVALTPTDVATDIQLVGSPVLQELVSKEIGQLAPLPSVTQVGLTQVLNIQVTTKSPMLSAQVANAYVDSYVKYTTNRYANQVAQQEKILQGERANLITQISDIETEIAGNKVTDPSNQSLNTQLSNYAGQLQTINNSLTQLQLDQSQVRAGAIGIAPAVVPTSPSSPKKTFDLLIGVLLGLFLGVGVALLLDYFDDRVRTVEELQQATSGLPLLGEIPLFEDWKGQSENAIIAAVRPNSAAAEAYRGLRTSIQFIGFDSEKSSVIQITSPAENEGKTTTAVDLAVALAAGTGTVALVSCDLRRPRIHSYFNSDNSVGLSSFLSGSSTIEEVVETSTEFKNLKFVSSGPIPPNPSELLGSPRLEEILQYLRETNDIVLVDSPPVLPVTDALVIAQVVGNVILICRANQTHGRAVERALDQLATVGAPMSGVVLNATVSTRKGYRYGGYKYGSYAYSSYRSDGK